MPSLPKSCERHSPLGPAGAEPAPKGVAVDPRSAVCVNASPVSADWFRLRKNPFLRPSVAKPEPTGTIQTELVLDLVKPIRNDLSDSDFEIVPGWPDEKPGEQKPGGARLVKPEMTGLTWSRLTARLFNAARGGA
jgi:hypothetical protein